jgi:hypothetical protein
MMLTGRTVAITLAIAAMAMLSAGAALPQATRDEIGGRQVIIGPERADGSRRVNDARTGKTLYILSPRRPEGGYWIVDPKTGRREGAVTLPRR